MKTKLIAIASAVTLALGASIASAAPGYTWQLVVGAGQTPAEYAEASIDCNVLHVFSWDGANQQWLTWHGPESDWILQQFNDDFTMDPDSGYWVACKEE